MPILEPLSFEVVSHSDEQTQRIGARLGTLLPTPCVVALMGPMGAGKTHFAKGVGIGWGAEQALRSPTFTLVQAHHQTKAASESEGASRRSGRAYGSKGPASNTLYHIDLYRAETDADLQSIGLDDILEEPDAVCLIEWPDRILDRLPPETIRVRIEVSAETKRMLTFSTQATSTWQILLAFRKSVYGV